MSQMQLLRAVISERLTVAAEEIFGVVGRTIAEYEAELSRQQKLLDIFMKPEILLKTELSQHSNQEESEITTDQAELPASHRRGWLQGLEVDNAFTKDSISSSFTTICVKDEDADEDNDNDADHDNDEPDDKRYKGQTHVDGEPLPCDSTEDTEADGGSGGGFPELTVDRDLCPTSAECSGGRREDGDGKNDWKEEAEGQQTQTCATDKQSENVFICGICGKSFTLKCNLKFHMRAHTAEKRVSCSFCRKEFNNQMDLEQHAFTHTGEKPYACHICYKAFTTKINLMSHLMKHSGEYSYTCSICGKGFGVSSYLKVHMRFHTGVKPHCCSVCGKAFQVKSNLRYHMRTHTGEKPYICSICGKGFTRSEVLKDHMNTHTGEKPYSCKVCGKCFTHRTGLIQHSKTHSVDSPHRVHMAYSQEIESGFTT